METHHFSRKYTVFVIIALLVTSLTYVVFKTEALSPEEFERQAMSSTATGRTCPPFLLRLREISSFHHPCFLDVWEERTPIAAPFVPSVPTEQSEQTEDTSPSEATSTEVVPVTVTEMEDTQAPASATGTPESADVNQEASTTPDIEEVFPEGDTAAQ